MTSNLFRKRRSAAIQAQADAGAGRGPRASLGRRLDEAAATVHQVVPAKLVMTVLGGLLGLLMAPWQLCLAWMAGGAVLEAWGWIATRPAAQGRRTGCRGRWNFAANFAAVNAWWAVLGVLFWRTGLVEGQVCAVVLWISLATMLVPLFYNTTWVFLLAGALPSAAAMTMIGNRDSLELGQLAPIYMALGISFVFALGRALETPSAQAAQRALNESLAQYRLLADSVTDVICRTDLNGVHSYVSPAVEKVLGFRAEELIGVARRDMIDPETYPPVRAAVARMIADPERAEVITSRVRHKDGRWLWLQTNAKVFCEDGVPVGVIDVTRDITEQVLADQALTAAKAEAEAATRAKGDFLANISHEIRTPMNGVLGALHLLEQEPISAEGRELMRQANDCGRMLSQLLNDLLDFSKIEAGQLELSPEPMNAAEALDGVLALLGGQARAKKIELRREVTAGDLWIEADPVRLRQVMFNLVGNAIKFTGQGHVAVRLAITDEGGARRVRLEVEDTGIGVPADVQPHLFERFRQADSSTARRFGGTGLGLSITQALVELMGGTIGFSSRDGDGSLFWIDFTAPAAEAAREEPVESGVLDGVCVLLVEDNPTNRLVARTLLGRLGAEIYEAEDGLAGLEAARTGRFDLILMDVQMPHMDGIEATRAIRGLQGPAAQIPIIGLTANVMTHQKSIYLAAGMNGVVGKPFSAHALLTEIGRLLSEPADEAVAV